MKKISTLITVFSVVTLLMSGCGLATNNEVPDQNMVQTSVASTIIALQTAMMANVTPTQAVTIEPPTAEVIPTFTSAPTQPPATAIPQPTATSRPAYRISDVQDITYPDNSVVSPGEKFTKTWRMTNAGMSTWTSDTKIVFVSGNSLGASSSATIGQTVAPNQTVDISLDLVAPSTPDTYTGNFMLQAPNGVRFGIGGDASNPFWVKVKVQAFFQVTSAIANVTPASYTGTCPYQLSFSATITSTAPGTVTYTYVTSTGTSKEYTMVFDAAGTKTSSVETWTVKETQSLEVHIYINNPNHQDFASVTIPITCTP